MKELLTSFLSSTRSNTDREKSILHGHGITIHTGLIRGTFLVCLLFTLFTTTSFSQSNASDPVAAPITTDAYPHNEWKSLVDYTAVINSEQSETLTLLADPNLTPSQLALYTGYSRLLTYIKTDLDAKLPIANIAYTNFKKVTQEATTDPKLIDMSMGSFQTMYNALVVKLHQ